MLDEQPLDHFVATQAKWQRLTDRYRQRRAAAARRLVDAVIENGLPGYQPHIPHIEERIDVPRLRQATKA